MDLDSEKVIAVEREVDISVEVVQEETIVCHADVESGVDGSQEEARQSSDENTPSQMVGLMPCLNEMIPSRENGIVFVLNSWSY